MRAFWLASALLAASPAHAATLWQVWQAARAIDPAFAAAAAQLRVAAAGQPAALAALLPHLAVAASAGPEKDYLVEPDFYGTGFEPISQTQKIGASSWQVTLTQCLFNWQALQTYHAAGLTVQAAAAAYQANLEALNVAVVTDYVAVQAAEADVASLRQAAQGFNTQYHDAEARYQAGLSGIIGAEESLAADRAIQTQLLQAQQTLIAAQQSLAALTGDAALQPDAALPEVLALPPDQNIDDWLDQAARGNPSLAAAQLTVADDAALVAAAKGGYLPNVSLQLQHAQIAQGGAESYAFGGQAISGEDNVLQQNNSVTVQLTWNVFDGGATHAAADQAEATQDQAVANAATARLDVIRTVRTDDAALVLDRDQLSTARAAAKAATQAVHDAGDGVRAGLVSEDDLIADRQQLLSAQLALHAAMVAAIGHELGLAQAAGSATPALVATLSRLLDLTPKEPNDDR